MASDWIKMRITLAKDPAVIAMADYLAEQKPFINWLTDPVHKSCQKTAYEHVTRNVTVAVTVSALLAFWGVANEVGKPDGDDLLMRHATLSAVDEVTGIPCFGDAMTYVDWVVQETIQGKPALRLPKFLINNTPAEDRSKRSNAERQRRFREKKGSVDHESNAANDVTSNAPSNVTVTHREDESREETVPKGTVVGAAKAASSAKKKLGARLPEDWALPKSWGEWALNEYGAWTAEKVRVEAAKFRDHWIAKTGKGATALDWQAVWRNWCRSDIAHRDDPKPPGQGVRRHNGNPSTADLMEGAL